MIATNDTTTTTTTTLTARPHVRASSLARETLFGRVGLGFALVVSAILNLWNLQQNRVPALPGYPASVHV